MPLMPFQVLGIWLRGLLAIAIIAAGLYLIRSWSEHRHVVVQEPPVVVRTEKPPTSDVAGVRPGPTHVETIAFGFNPPSVELLGGIALMLLSLGGGRLAVPMLRKRGEDEPKEEHGGEIHRIERPDGSVLYVECHGPADAQPIVLTHGWGADLTEWYYARRELGPRFRLILWDLPGLGKSTRPANNDYRLENLANDLDAVLALAGDRPAILLGHSIGGMITLTFCRLFPEALTDRVAGLVLVHTTYTNPVKTTKMRQIYEVLQRPLLEPLCHLMIWLAPLVWAMNWLTYLNGSMQRSNDKHTFCGTETRGQLEFVSRFMPKAWPGVVARGMLAMFRYDATPTLTTIGVPTLVVAGDRDETTQPDASAFMAETIPRASLSILKPAKHFGLIEQHKGFAEAVAAFAETGVRHPATVPEIV